MYSFIRKQEQDTKRREGCKRLMMAVLGVQTASSPRLRTPTRGHDAGLSDPRARSNSFGRMPLWAKKALYTGSSEIRGFPLHIATFHYLNRRTLAIRCPLECGWAVAGERLGVGAVRPEVPPHRSAPSILGGKPGRASCEAGGEGERANPRALRLKGKGHGLHSLRVWVLPQPRLGTRPWPPVEGLGCRTPRSNLLNRPTWGDGAMRPFWGGGWPWLRPAQGKRELSRTT